MIVTEEDARKRWCPEVRTPGGNLVVHKGHDTRMGKCISSDCMAWRWFDNTDDQAIKEPLGYCGKAGKP
jgi:hypothetical protein